MATKKFKERIHREWFRTVMDKRKSCPNCREKLPIGESIWSWGEYVRAKWRTVGYFCIACFPSIRRDLEIHKNHCGCKFELVGYGGQELPEWLSVDSESCQIAIQRLQESVI